MNKHFENAIELTADGGVTVDYTKFDVLIDDVEELV
jgi:hypothetical protein